MVLDGVSVFLMVLSPPVSPCLPMYPFLFPFDGWCVRLPKGLPHMRACVGWCARLPEVLSPCLPTCVPVLDSASGLVSHCLPTCVPLLDGVSAFSRFVSPCLHPSPFGWCVCAFPQPCLRLSPIVSPCVCVWACVRRGVCFPEALSPLLSPLVSPCLPRLLEVLSPMVYLHVCLCWVVCPPSQGSLLPALAILFQGGFVPKYIILPK